MCEGIIVDRTPRERINPAPQIGDIWKFDYYKTLEPEYLLIEDIDDSMPGDEIIHFRSLTTNETGMRFIHTFLGEQPTKVA